MNNTRKEDIMNKDTVLSNIKGAGMTEAAKLAKREYFRKWKKANPDKVKLYQERYWERKAQEMETGSTEAANA